jgi:hypothetical protein
MSEIRRTWIECQLTDAFSSASGISAAFGALRFLAPRVAGIANNSFLLVLQAAVLQFLMRGGAASKIDHTNQAKVFWAACAIYVHQLEIRRI